MKKNSKQIIVNRQLSTQINFFSQLGFLLIIAVGGFLHPTGFTSLIWWIPGGLAFLQVSALIYDKGMEEKEQINYLRNILLYLILLGILSFGFRYLLIRWIAILPGFILVGVQFWKLCGRFIQSGKVSRSFWDLLD